MFLSRYMMTILVLLLFEKIQAQESTIATTGNHIFYEGIPNPIIILIDGIPVNDLVAAEDAVISGSKGKYNVDVKIGPWRTCNIR